MGSNKKAFPPSARQLGATAGAELGARWHRGTALRAGGRGRRELGATLGAELRPGRVHEATLRTADPCRGHLERAAAPRAELSASWVLEAALGAEWASLLGRRGWLLEELWYEDHPHAHARPWGLGHALSGFLHLALAGIPIGLKINTA